MKKLMNDWRLAWLLLLLPVALLLPATPIDETRYLAVAWEMRVRGDFLVSHLNGTIYSEKTPLFFWLMNLDWLLVGIHVWAVRVSVLAVAFGSLFLFQRLALRLSSSITLAMQATLLFAGMVFMAMFSTLIMFDVLLAACVLIAFHGVLDLDAQRWRRGTAVLALGIGLGLLTKGPPTFLYVGLPALLAPWWSLTARENKLRWYGSVLLGFAGGALIVLAWVIPWALTIGKQNFDAILLHQTVGRMTKSFAHQRPGWWYLMVLPIMLLPWPLSVRAPRAAWMENFHISKTARFGIAWFLPTFVAFCFVSGKQPHYLLPLLPGIALFLAQLLEHDRARLSARPFAGLLLLAGCALAAVPYLADHAATLPVLGNMVTDGSLTPASLAVFATLWPAWGVLIAAVGAGLFWMGAHANRTMPLAFASTICASLGMLALTQGAGATIDVSGVANRIRADQASGKPVVHLGWHHGLFEFAGRLTEPLPTVELGDLVEWCRAHPDGDVVTFYSKYKLPAMPTQTIAYRLGSKIQIWHAADILVQPPAAQMKPDEDDTPDE